MFRRKGPSEVEVAKENEIKLAITQELSKALKDVQKENIGTEDQAVYSTETANAVCTCLEAILLHGLKAKAMNKLASYMGMGQQALSQPSLNFWNFAAKFTHGEVISQLKHLGQITTEIGLCRAWVRVALNDGLMESYIDSMVADKKTLDNYFHRTAYLRDSEQPEIMKTLLHGLMTFEFKLSYNASVLNQWSYGPLTLAGIIDSREAPPPIIKPPVSKPQASKSDQGQRSVSSSATRERRKSKQKHRLSNNPMEGRTFGQPSEDTYYVTSSEFTTKDVENIKRLGRNSDSTISRSECSSSSHVSCPDPAIMNISPANYVPKGLAGRGNNTSQSENSPDLTPGIPEDQHQSGPVMYDENFIESNGGVKAGLSNEGANEQLSVDSDVPSSEVSEQTATAKLDVDNIISDLDLPPVSQPPDELLNDIYSELNPADIEVEDTESVKKNELEESWEAFYKTPVKKPNSDSESEVYKKFQRLESFTQDMREKAIVGDYEADDEVTDNMLSIQEVERDSFAVSDMHGKESNENETLVKDHLPEQKPQENIDQPFEIVMDQHKQTGDMKRIYSEHSVTSHVETIIKEENVKASSSLTESNLKLLEEELSSYVEEKVKIGEVGNEVITHEHVSPVKKKKKDRSSASLNRLKPPLSFSPPKQGPLTPELSDAVAKDISTVPVSSNQDYLKKHRLSLPAVNTVQTASKYDHRQSMPNLTEGIEDDLLREIYDGIPLDNDKNDGKDTIDEILNDEEDKLRQKMMNNEPRQSLGNSLVSGRGWSSSFESEAGDTVDALSPPKVPGSLPIRRPKAESFGTLLQNYTPSSSIGARSIDDILHNFPENSGSVAMSPHSSGLSPTNEEADNLDDFEVVSETDNFDPDTVNRLTQLAEIVNEKGLDAQNFQCKGCQRAVGMIFGKPRVCKFDGGYYCYECHENEEYYIPALIVHNWDFRKHKVAKKNLQFIQEVEEQPCINVELSNPRLYEHVNEMQDIKALRNQLMYLKSYLFTCKQSIAEDLRRLVWPRDYLFENTEEYSLADFLQVPTGALAGSLKKVIRFCTKHVYSCRLCSQKGFICELCHNPKVIYPFETDNTYRCPTCKSVFHKDCKTDNRPCPKCQRRLRRESTHGIVETPTAVDYAFVSS